MKLIDLLKSLGKKAKIDLEKPEFKAVLDASAEVEVSQADADQLEAALMTVDAAIAHPDVKKKIMYEVLNGEDAFLNGLVPELDLDDDVKTTITAEKDTRAKIRKTIASLTEKAKKAKKAGDDPAAEVLKHQIATLNAELKSIKDTHTGEIQKISQERENDFINYQLMSLLGVKQYALPEKMPIDRKIKTALLAVQETMAQKGLKVVKDGAGVKLVKIDGSEPYDDKNNFLILPSFIDGVLAENDLLKNSDSSQGNQSQQSHSQNGSNGQQQPNHSAFLAQNSKAIQEMIAM